MGRKHSWQRRSFLKAAGGLVLAGVAPAMPARAGVRRQHVCTLIDVDRCTGCGACVQACRARNMARVPLPEKPIPEPYPGWVHVSDWSERRDVTDRLTPYNWLYIQSCNVPTPQGSRAVFLPRRCMHCINPPCVNRCPTGGARQSSLGVTYIDHDICMGDGQCERACPWMIPRRQSGVGPYLRFAPRYIGNGMMFKCDFCMELLERGQGPACVAACPSGAQSVGPYTDILSKVTALAGQRSGDIFGLKENGGTNTIYVSSVPFRDIEAALLSDGLVSFGRPSLRPAGASMDRENRLLGTVLLAPLAGAALAGVRIWREKQKRRKL